MSIASHCDKCQIYNHGQGTPLIPRQIFRPFFGGSLKTTRKGNQFFIFGIDKQNEICGGHGR
jgi:hypothetical protein